MSTSGLDTNSERAFIRATEIARNLQSQYVTVEMLALALIENKAIESAIIICGVDPASIYKEIQDQLDQEVEQKPTKAPTLTRSLNNVGTRAGHQMAQAGKKVMGIHHLMASVLGEDDSFSKFIFESNGVDRQTFLKAFYQNRPIDEEKIQEIDPMTGMPTNRSSDPLKDYCVNLNEMAKDGKIDRLIGRETEVHRTIQILSRRRKNNPILVGEPGVGKTAIAEGLAYKIVKGEVPKHIDNAVVYSLDMGSLLAGTKFRGEFEERLKDVINAIKKLNEDGQAILFIDEIHMIIGAGAGSSGAMDASNILKPALAKGEIHCIGSTTYDEFNKHFEKDSALKRRFKKVDISEPSSDETKDILLGLSKYFEEFHEIKFTNDALFAAVDLAVKHIHDNKLPDKAIDVIDEAGAAQRLLDDDKRLAIIDVSQIEEVVAQMARIPEITVKKDDSETLKVLSSTMKNFVFGQNDPIDELTRSIKISRAGLREKQKPIGSFLFAGPTGVGKTEMAKQLARILGIHYERIDMSEYMEKHTVSKLIGAPAGYVGHDDGDGRLIEAVDKHPHMVLLLDEVEKAHSDVFNILLQVMDDAKLTSGRGKIARFENVIIIMTSNAGAASAQKSNIGFGAGMNDGAMIDSVNKMFAPEFRNRLDKIMYFNRLAPETMICIVDKFLNELQVQLDEKEIILEVNSEAKEWLSIKGYDPLFGARPLSRVIQENIKDNMADEILFGGLKHGGVAMVKMENDELILTTRKSSKLPVKAIVESVIEEK